MKGKKILTTKVLPSKKMEEEEEQPNSEQEKEEEKVKLKIEGPYKSCLSKHCDGSMYLQKKDKKEEMWKCTKCNRGVSVML